MTSIQPSTLKRKARKAGLFYLIVAIIAPIGLMYIPSQIILWDDATATIENILNNTFLFRSSIAIRILVQVLMLLTVWHLFLLLKSVNHNQARLMLLLYSIAVPIGFLVNVFNIATLGICNGVVFQSLSSAEMNEFAMMFLRLGSYDTQLVQLFWGLWLIPFGLLIFQSKFIPKVFGVLVYLNGVAYIIECLTFVLFPDYQSQVSKITLPLLFLGEIPIILWLVIIGVKKDAPK